MFYLLGITLARVSRVPNKVDPDVWLARHINATSLCFQSPRIPSKIPIFPRNANFLKYIQSEFSGTRYGRIYRRIIAPF